MSKKQYSKKDLTDLIAFWFLRAKDTTYKWERRKKQYRCAGCGQTATTIEEMEHTEKCLVGITETIIN